MKNLIINLTLLLSTLLFTIDVNAQTCSVNIGSACAGECGQTGIITHYIPRLPRGQFEVYRFCLDVTENSLCASENAYANVYINNVLRFGGLVPKNQSPTINFWARDGSHIRVEVTHSNDPNTNILCKRLGNIKVNLKGEL